MSVWVYHESVFLFQIEEKTSIVCYRIEVAGKKYASLFYFQV